MSNYLKSNSISKPSKTGRCNCTRCGGGGVVPPWGQCFRCGGCGADPSARSWVFPSDWTDEQCEAHLQSLEQKSADRAVKSRLKAAEKAEATHAANVAACPALARLDDDAYRGQFDGFVLDIYHKSHRYTLSEKQLAAVTKAVEQKDGYLARKAGWEAQKAEDRANAKPLPSGRVEITGTVLSIKTYTSQYGYHEASCLKALLQCDGYKLFGTLPAAIAESAKVGDLVKVTATVKEKEPGFGTYSRPTHGEVLSA